MFKYIFAVITGILFGAVLGVYCVVKVVRKRIKRTVDQMTDGKLESKYKAEIDAYIDECQKATERNLRKKFKQKDPILFVKLIRLVKERRQKEKLYNEVHIPPDEPEEPIVEPIEDRGWYPFYLMLHSIGQLYQGDSPLSFLELNEKDVFGIVQKVSSALMKLFDGIGIERLARIKCSFVLDTVNIIRQVLIPFGNSDVKSAYQTSMQGLKEFNKIKNTISLNPFYHLRVFVKKKISNALIIESVKCVVDVVAIEIVNVYNEKTEN